MLSNLPVELILMCCEYLTFNEIDKLAWINRRMMQIIKRHVKIALEPRIEVVSLGISRNYNKKGEFNFYFSDNNSRRFPWYSSSIRFNPCIKNIKQRKAFGKVDRAAVKVFQKYYRYGKITKKYPESTLTWRNYATSKRNELPDSVRVFPRLEIHSLLSCANFNTIYIDGLNRDHFWSLIDILDNNRTRINQKHISCRNLKLSANDKHRFLQSAFLQEGIVEFIAYSSPFIIELLINPNYRKTDWKLTNLDNESSARLHDAKAEKLTVHGCSISIRQLLSGLLIAKPDITSWKLNRLKNLDKGWGWEIIESVLSEAENLVWKIIESHEFRRKYVIYLETHTWIIEIDHDRWRRHHSRQKCYLYIENWWLSNANDDNISIAIDLNSFNIPCILTPQLTFQNQL